MATVFTFPAGRAQAPASQSAAGAAAARGPGFAPRRMCEVGLAGVAHLLGLADRPQRAILAHVRLLVDRYGFPPPKTPRFVNGERLTGGRAVAARSVWNRDQVEQWIDGDAPPPLAAARAQARRDGVRAQLAERARALGGAA